MNVCIPDLKPFEHVGVETDKYEIFLDVAEGRIVNKATRKVTELKGAHFKHFERLLYRFTSDARINKLCDAACEPINLLCE